MNESPIHSEEYIFETFLRDKNNPPILETLAYWITAFSSEEWGSRLRYINESMESFYQGPLEILRYDGTENLVGIVFTNTAFLREMQPHLRSKKVICMDGTFQTTPRETADINQLFTIQIILNNVAIPNVHALLVDRQTETYCQVLQYLKYKLRLNINYDNMQVITDFKQGLRNAITQVLLETNNTGYWFHYIQSIVCYVQSNQLVNLCRVNENARRILRMLMALAHLPATKQHHHGNSYSIQLGFRVVQDLIAEYNLSNELHDLMRYYKHFWIDNVTPTRFTVCMLQHRTNNYIESYHASLLKLMGQHSPFYDHLRKIEERARNDFGRAVNGQRVRQANNTMYSHNDITIRNAWVNVQNGKYDLRDLIQNVAYTPEQLLRHEIGESNFAHQPEPSLPVNNRPLPVQNDVVELCIICMDREVVVTLVPCSHKFCNTCVAQMMQQNYNICPLCRGQINSYNGLNLE